MPVPTSPTPEPFSESKPRDLFIKDPAYIDHFRSIFEDLWAKGIDAEDRIKEIHEGTDLTDIEIIQNPRIR